MQKNALFILSMLLAGCTVSPSVSYLEINGGDTDGYIKFHLVSGNILLSESEPSQVGRDEINTPKLDSIVDTHSSKLAASVVPKEQGTLYALIPKKQWMGMVSTNISSTYYDNTRLLHKIGVEVIDNRIKVIEALGAGAKSFVSKASDGNGEELKRETDSSPVIVLPIVIALESGTPASATWQPLPRNEKTGWFYRLIKTSKTPSKDSSPTADFIKAHSESHWYNPISWSRETSAFPLSACEDYSLEVSPLKDAQIRDLKELSHDAFQRKVQEIVSQNAAALEESKHKHVFGLRIPDPSRITTITLPAKGELVTHTLCGGNVVTETASTSSTYDLISSLIKQAQSLSESQGKTTGQ